MKNFHPEKIRNIALVAHQGAGKTTLSESMLHRMGVVTRMGSVEEGSTVSDFRPDEIQRQISIATTLVVGEHKGIKMNLLDTPGFTDFIGEVKCAVRVADVVGVLIHAGGGIEVGTEIVWGFADELNLPRFVFVNQLDREHVNFDRVVDSLKEAYTSVAPIAIPVNPGNDGFNAIIDLLSMKVVTYNPDGTEKGRSEIPADMKATADEWRQKLVESVSETDDQLMEKFFENDGLSQEDLMSGLRKGFREGLIYPLLCGNAKKQVGTLMLLDFLRDIAPSPLDKGIVIAKHEGTLEEVKLPCDGNAPFAGLVFKTVSDKHIGDLSLFRVYSGCIQSGDEVRNSSRGHPEKIGGVFISCGKNRKNIDDICAGDLGALVKLKDTHTNDTLCATKDPLILAPIIFPAPVTRSAIEAKNKGDEEKVSSGLHILEEEDPSFHFSFDTEMSQLIIEGQGEMQLTVILERLKERSGVEVDLVKPLIPYRETIKSTSEAQGKHKKQSGGRGQFGDCWLKLEPSIEKGKELEFVDAIVGGVIPGKFLPAIEKGIRSTLDEGVVGGFKVIDVKVTCYDGSYHTVDSSEAAFKIAGSLGFKKAFKEAKPVILEPIYNLEVRVPEQYMGDVMGDVSSRRGKVMGMDREGRFQVIKAKVPLAELDKYSATLRSLTGGRGIHTASFSHYEEVPGDIQKKLVDAYEARRAAGSD